MEKGLPEGKKTKKSSFSVQRTGDDHLSNAKLVHNEFAEAPFLAEIPGNGLHTSEKLTRRVTICQEPGVAASKDCLRWWKRLHGMKTIYAERLKGDVACRKELPQLRFEARHRGRK